MKFNEKLIEIRKKQGLSQEELGMELQVSRQTISKWETGLPHTEIIRKYGQMSLHRFLQLRQIYLKLKFQWELNMCC